MNIAIAYTENKTYPLKEERFRPSRRYPEIPFPLDLSNSANDVYDMVREALHLCSLDEENYGTSIWNPLGDIIQPGDQVLVKPNLVMHYNPNGDGYECLYTQPAVTAAVIDYILIANKGRGRIIIGDAPMQECQFETLIQESGYDKLLEYYCQKGVDIKLCDFRNVKTYLENGVHRQQMMPNSNGILVRLGNESSFHGLPEEHLKNMRITNYDPRILQMHHTIQKHEYLIAEEVLQADVVINLPKPKTHRKAGITACLKNLVGINTSKEYLPHHTNEGKSDKGDAYEKKHLSLRLANRMLDKKNMLENEGKYFWARTIRYPMRILFKLGEKVFREKYMEGSWYGNETIWRTILDLNKILLYADKAGKMRHSSQRKVFHIADMIISGENDGPVNPSAKPLGIIVAGEDAVAMDETIAALMGFEPKLISTLREARHTIPHICSSEQAKIVSNNDKWHEKSCNYIKNKSSFHFVATFGWKKRLTKDGRQ